MTTQWVSHRAWKLFAVLSVVVSAAFSTLGCGGTNLDACEAYVAQVNETRSSCDDPARLDPNEQCPAELNQRGVDCTAVYECLGASYVCRDGEVQCDDDQPTCGLRCGTCF